MTNRSGLSDEILALVAWKGYKKEVCTRPLQSCWAERVKKKHCWTYRIRGVPSVGGGGLLWGDQAYNIWTGNGKSNYDIKQCKNKLLQGWPKGTVTLLAVKEYWYKKLQRQKSPVKNLLEFSCKSGSRRPCFTGIKNRWFNAYKGVKRGESKQYNCKRPQQKNR
jgi:hypothetical protein